MSNQQIKSPFQLFSFCLILLLVYSCGVPIEQQVLLQQDSKSKSYRENSVAYKLQGDDVISIRIKSLTPDTEDPFNDPARLGGNNRIQDPILTGYLVDKNGDIQLPVVGAVNVEGLTLTESQDKVKKIVSAYLRSPSVEIKLLSFRVSVLGSVNSPGTYETYNPDLSILQAIGLAKGLGDYSNRAEIKIIRQEGKETKVGYINLLDDAAMTSPYFHMRPNDTVIVPPLQAQNFQDNQAKNISLILSALTVASLLFIRFSPGN